MDNWHDFKTAKYSIETSTNDRGRTKCQEPAFRISCQAVRITKVLEQRFTIELATLNPH